MCNNIMWPYSREQFGKFRKDKDTTIEVSIKKRLLGHFNNVYKENCYFADILGVAIPPYACAFSTGTEKVCLVADEDGFVSFVDIPSSRNSNHGTSLKVVKKWQTHNNAVFDVACAPNSNKFATASGDTTAILWDSMYPGQQLNIFRGHSCSLKSICISEHNSNLLATGSRDGNALIWDSRCSKAGVCQPVIRIQDAHAINDALTPQRKRRKMGATHNCQLSKDSRQTVTSVVFQDSNTLITSGAMDGTLKLWDLRKTQFGTGKCNKELCLPTPKECIKYPGCSSRRRGYSCLTLDSSHSRLFASCTDNTVYEYGLVNAIATESRMPVRKYTGHYSSSFYVRIKLSPDDLFLLSGCDDENAYIWTTEGNRTDKVLPTYCMKSGGTEQVTSVAWCQNDWTQVVTCSDDCTVRLWRLPSSWPSVTPVDGYFEKQLHVSINANNEIEYKTKKDDTLANPLEQKQVNKKFESRTPTHSRKVKQSSLKKWIKHNEYAKFKEEKKARQQLNFKTKNAEEKENTVSSLGLHKSCMRYREGSIIRSPEQSITKTFDMKKDTTIREKIVNFPKRLLKIDDFFLRNESENCEVHVKSTVLGTTEEFFPLQKACNSRKLVSQKPISLKSYENDNKIIVKSDTAMQAELTPRRTSKQSLSKIDDYFL